MEARALTSRPRPALSLQAASNGEYAKAIEAFTAAVQLMPSPLLYAKRADAYLKLKKPNAAVRDANKALEINPDSVRTRA